MDINFVTNDLFNFHASLFKIRIIRERDRGFLTHSWDAIRANNSFMCNVRVSFWYEIGLSKGF